MPKILTKIQIILKNPPKFIPKILRSKKMSKIHPKLSWKVMPKILTKNHAWKIPKICP